MLEETSLLVLFLILFILVLLSAFFSSAETALISLNRYRLGHLIQQGNRGAVFTGQLVSHPQLLVILVLLGKNFVNILASAIAAIIGIKLLGENGLIVAVFTLTLILLLFSELTPKALAAQYPEPIALPASFILRPLLCALYPLVFFIKSLTNHVLLLFGISPDKTTAASINTEELRIALMASGTLMPGRHKDMLMSSQDLDKFTVNDVMVPRNEIEALDINAALPDIVKQLSNCKHSRLPIYKDSMDNIIGILHTRKALHLSSQNNLTQKTLTSIINTAYFVPEGTSLNTQLINFQHNHHNAGLVVDEYGDLLGLITLEDIFREIAGQFISDPFHEEKEIYPQADNSFIIKGTANIREINRNNSWSLPTVGPKTINGLVLEHLENIPDPGVSIRVDKYVIEVIQTTDNAIKTVRIRQIPFSTNNSEYR